MKFLEAANLAICKRFIRNLDHVQEKRVRIQYGLLAGWISIIAIVILFVVKMVLGLMAGSVSIMANAFHLLSHLANSTVLVLSFWITSRPATVKTPFGHGRMEQIAPLIMSVFLFVAGIQIAERSIHQVTDPHAVHYWTALPWILLATIAVKQWLSQFVRFIGKRVSSHAILATSTHHRIDAIITITVIGGVVAGHHYHHPELDGYIGILASVWLLYLGYNHGRESITPILGKAPSKHMIREIRETAKSIDGIEDVHEIIVHDYGSMYIMTLHAEILEAHGPEKMHEIAEKCEAKLRNIYRGEVVCHTDPLMENSPEIQAIEQKFKQVVRQFPSITAYHDFRVVAESPERIIILADIDVAEDVPEKEFETIASELESQVNRAIPNIAYCGFYVTPKFAY